MKRLLALPLLCGLLLWTAPLHAQDAKTAATGRKLLKDNQKAVISVTAVLKINIEAEGGGSGSEEQQQQALATIVDSDGLAVTSLAGLDPTSASSTVRRNIQGQIRVFHLKGELRDVKYRLADGTEVPARVLRTDEDLDLAYLGPQTPLDADTKGKISAIALEDAAPEAEMLDTLVFLARLGKTFNYGPALFTANVTAKVTKPRTQYVCAEMISAGIVGSPCFTADGKLLGIVLTHAHKDENEGGANMQVRSTAVVVPVADIKESYPAAKEDLKKPAPATTPASTSAPAEEPKE